MEAAANMAVSRNGIKYESIEVVRIRRDGLCAAGVVDDASTVGHDLEVCGIYTPTTLYTSFAAR